MREEPEKTKPTNSQILDYHTGVCQSVALEIADEQQKPFLTSSVADFMHRITNQSRPVMQIVYAGPDAHEVADSVMRHIKGVLTEKHGGLMQDS